MTDDTYRGFLSTGDQKLTRQQAEELAAWFRRNQPLEARTYTIPTSAGDVTATWRPETELLSRASPH